MPTDERVREQFEEAIKRDCPAITADDFDGWDADTETYAWQSITDMWIGFRSRDAEVQALKEQNHQYYDLLLVVALANDGHGWLNPDVSDRIDAALAGGETGETE